MDIVEKYVSCDDTGVDHLLIIEGSEIPIRKTYLEHGGHRLSLATPEPIKPEYKLLIEAYAGMSLKNYQP